MALFGCLTLPIFYHFRGVHLNDVELARILSHDFGPTWPEVIMLEKELLN